MVSGIYCDIPSMNEQNASADMLSGRLSEDSPALCDLIGRVFGASTLGRLERMYSQQYLQNGAPELCERKAGIRFNPRPARILHILLTEAGMRDEASISEAFTICFADPMRVLHSTWPEQALQRDIRAAILLDDVRHFHMFSLANQKQTRATLLALRERQAQSLTNIPRLQNLLHKALVRLNLQP